MKLFGVRGRGQGLVGLTLERRRLKLLQSQRVLTLSLSLVAASSCFNLMCLASVRQLFVPIVCYRLPCFEGSPR